MTGYQPRVYTGGMVGFGRYAYTYASGHSGTSMATGFAPRKADLSIYVMPGQRDIAPLLARLGKHRMGKACLYLRHLADADEGVLRELIATRSGGPQDPVDGRGHLAGHFRAAMTGKAGEGDPL